MEYDSKFYCEEAQKKNARIEYRKNEEHGNDNVIAGAWTLFIPEKEKCHQNSLEYGDHTCEL
jgi:hypothetical protein